MENEVVPTENEHQSDGAPVRRERLYELVWSEPMLRVAERFSVSSSYLARICTQLNVPRPERGYWAKLAAGKKATPRPPLPDARPGDELVWAPHGAPVNFPRPRPRPPAELPKTAPRQIQRGSKIHPLVVGAKALFEAGRTSHDSEYLRPAKKLLVDIVATRPGLDKALNFANELFLALDARGHRIVIAPSSEQFVRAGVDEREAPPRKDQRERYHLWSPGRITVVYIGTVAIGLSTIEMSENVEVRYVNGEYIRQSDYVAPKRRSNLPDYTWTTRKDLATGRICLQAYSPYSFAKWTRQWRETPDKRIDDTSAIVKELEQSVTEIARLHDEGKRRAELEHQRWQAQMAEWQRKEEERRIAKARQDSTDELLEIIESWAATKRLEAFFADAERRLEGTAQDDHQQTLDRLNRARELIGSANALERFARWKAPDER